MSSREQVMQNLYRRGKVTAAGLRQAVADGVITAEAYEQITGESLPQP